jgi:hypothetical protein
VKPQNNSCRKAGIVVEAQPLASACVRTPHRLAKKSPGERELLQQSAIDKEATMPRNLRLASVWQRGHLERKKQEMS